MAQGYSVKGLLAPLWKRIGGRDALAEATGISPTLLSSYNTGKGNLGRVNAERIIAAIPGATLADLAIPPADEPSPIMRELAAIRAQLEGGDKSIRGQLRKQDVLLLRLSELAAELAERLVELEKVADRLDAAVRAPRPRSQGQRPA